MNFSSYDLGGFHDEMFVAPGQPHPAASILYETLRQMSDEELHHRRQAAELALLNMGITFTVYGDESGTERIFPFDIIPRIIPPDDWVRIEGGLKQRIHALNLFLDDVYGDRKVIRDGIVPAHVVDSSRCLRHECTGIKPPQGIWCHVTGTDLVRDNDGTFYVLEDNLRCPSGISYVLENRQVMKRTFPMVFGSSNVRPVDDYPTHLLEALQFLAPAGVTNPNVVILTPGIYNSAYFEHSFLAQKMGIELVMGSDLVVHDGFVMMRTTQGLQRVDVIYRRIDDDFLDPEAFRKDSLIGVPGLFDCYKQGRVAIANAPGTGVADDKVIYAYVPRLIKYYLDEDPILPNVPTFPCWEEKEREHVLANLDKFVVKAANEAGGYGMLVGPHATPTQRREFAELIRANPRNYIGQPTVSLSRAPTLVDGECEGRHVDLRPYIVYGKEIYVLPGGLTRVALKRGSLVVNSSQGGGSKDTWVVSNSNTRGAARC